MSFTTIRIKEKNFTDNTFSVTVSITEPNGFEEEAEIKMLNPYDSKTDDLLEWYFEQYISKPYDDVKVKDAVNAIEAYGKNLFSSLFVDNILYRYKNVLQTSGPEKISIVIIGDSAAFQAIYWESLWGTNQAHPLAALGTNFIRKNVKLINIRAQVEISSTINLLIVTARPNEENDVNYRTIQRPLIDLIEKTATPVNAHILRPGTYEALMRHLDNKKGYYHIIHFDVHGALLDFETYQLYQQETKNLSTELFKSSFGLKELKEANFNDGKKSFIFFESEEKGIAIPVDAEQLADYLEHRQIPICILNACQSAKQDNSASETSLGRVLMKKGMQFVLAMRYSVSVSAAQLMMKRLYEQLYKQLPIEQTIAASRQELYRRKSRSAAYNYDIELEDWMLPVVYENARPVLNIRSFTPEEEEKNFLEKQLPEEVKQQLPFGFFGRDLDILKIEKALLLRSNILLLQGMGGAGKTSLLKYLSGWWLRTGFIQKVFYFGYDLKAYTINEILFKIAQAIYNRHEFGSFMAKMPEIQEKNIVDKLKTERCVLILDNAESIIGEKLAIPNTLSLKEQTKLKNFIANLKGGESFVIIGSRANEEWLSKGTFGTNKYLLQGLDKESASDFSEQIFTDINISVKTVIGDPNFERLMKLLAGFPLAIKAILPNFKKKTATQILKELEEGFGGLDSENIQERTESIIKCIEYAHSNLSNKAQQLLLCLAPFQSQVNLHSDIIGIYFNELKKEIYFKDYPFNETENIIREAIQNGFMQEIFPDDSSKLMYLQPIFTYFLKNKLNQENNTLQLHLQTAFINYYKLLSITFTKLLTSKEPSDQELGLVYVRYEYENLFRVLNLLLDKEKFFFNIYEVIYEYLNKSQFFEKVLQLSEMVHNRMELFSHLKENLLFINTFIDVKFKLAESYSKFKKYDLEQILNEQILNLQNIGSLKNDKSKNGIAYMNLGNLSSKKRDFVAAKHYHEIALEILIGSDHIYEQGMVYHSLGIVLSNLKDFDAAKKYLKESLNIYGDFKKIIYQADIYIILGSILTEEGDYVAAIVYYEKALVIYEQYNDLEGQGQANTNLGLALSDLKKLDTAKYYFENALVIFIKLEDIHSQGIVYLSLGVNSKRQKDYFAAKDYYEKAMKIYKEYRDLNGQADLYCQLGLLFEEQKMYNEVKNCYKNALDIFLRFSKSTQSILDIVKVIYEFAKKINEKLFGQTMIQEALPYFEGDNKADLQKMLDDLDKL